MRGEILRPDGSEVIADEGRALISDGAALGEDIAARLRARAPEDFFSWVN